MVAEGPRGKIFVSPTEKQIAAVKVIKPDWIPEGGIPERLTGGTCFGYGLKTWADIFTPRQFLGLVTLSDLIREMLPTIQQDATAAKLEPKQAEAYARDLSILLALALDRSASFNNSLCRWNGNQTVFVFTKQALPMVWDFSEANLMGDRAVSWLTAVDIVADAVETIPSGSIATGYVTQHDAARPDLNTKFLVYTTLLTMTTSVMLPWPISTMCGSDEQLEICSDLCVTHYLFQKRPS